MKCRPLTTMWHPRDSMIRKHVGRGIYNQPSNSINSFTSKSNMNPIFLILTTTILAAQGNSINAIGCSRSCKSQLPVMSLGCGLTTISLSGSFRRDSVRLTLTPTTGNKTQSLTVVERLMYNPLVRRGANALVFLDGAPGEYNVEVVADGRFARKQRYTTKEPFTILSCDEARRRREDGLTRGKQCQETCSVPGWTSKERNKCRKVNESICSGYSNKRLQLIKD